MSQELMWLTLTVAMTAMFWIPYVLNRMAVRGLAGTLANPSVDAAAQSQWAERAINAHRNAVENLIVFAALVLTAHAMGLSNGVTQTACAVYFFARLVHFVVYAMGVPGLRTLAFAAGFGAQIALAVAILGASPA